MRIILLLSCMATLSAQNPEIRAGGIVNAASLAVAGLPNSGVAQGSQFAIFGSNLGPPEEVKATSFPFPTADGVGGVSVKIASGGSEVDAIMVSASARRVVAVMPSSVPAGAAQVTLTYSGNTARSTVEVLAVNFGIFTQAQSGSGPAVLRNLAEDGTGTPNSFVTPARPGARAALQGTGLGAVSGDEASGPITGDIAGDLEVFVGGKTATVVSKGRAECCAGVDQVVFETPADVLGCTVPVAVRAAGRVSNFATMAISTAGGCSDPGGFTAADLERIAAAAEWRGGGIVLSRSSFSVQGFDISSESAGGSFSKFRTEGLLSAQTSGNPSIGSCVVIVFGDFIPLTFEFTSLDAGPSLELRGPKGARTLQKRENTYSVMFPPGGPAIPGLPAPETYLDPGAYTITGPGGADVGAFSATLTLGPALNWTNRTTVGNSGPDAIVRTNEVPVTWTGGGANDIVTISGFSSLLQPQATASFRCLERASMGRFTIPSWVLSALPPSPNGFLSLTTGGDPVRFEASGIDFGTFSASSGSSRQIAFR